VLEIRTVPIRRMSSTSGGPLSCRSLVRLQRRSDRFRAPRRRRSLTRRNAFRNIRLSCGRLRRHTSSPHNRGGAIPTLPDLAPMMPPRYSKSSPIRTGERRAFPSQASPPPPHKQQPADSQQYSRMRRRGGFFSFLLRFFFFFFLCFLGPLLLFSFVPVFNLPFLLFLFAHRLLSPNSTKY